MRFTVEPSGFDRALGDLRAMQERGEDVRPALREAADDFRVVMGEQFSTAGALSGGWVGLSPGYQARKQRDRPGRRIGVYTGVMERSLTTGGGGHQQRVTKSRLEVGSSATARGRARHVHLFDRGRGNQPARTVVPPAAVFERRWSPIFERHLAGDGYTGVV